MMQRVEQEDYNMIDVNRLYDYGKVKGACLDGLEIIKSANSEQELIELFIKKIDFCLLEDFPNKQYLLDNGGEYLANNQVYIDAECVLDGSVKAVLMGTTKGSLNVDNYDVSELYLSHTSSLSITATDNAYLSVELFGRSQLSINAGPNVKGILVLNGPWTHADIVGGNIKVIRK